MSSLAGIRRDSEWQQDPNARAGDGNDIFQAIISAEESPPALGAV